MGSGFNEAAGFTRRKLDRLGLRGPVGVAASMRPPDLPGGNFNRQGWTWAAKAGFNEAAGFTRRKPSSARRPRAWRRERFNEAAGFTRRKHVKEKR